MTWSSIGSWIPNWYQARRSGGAATPALAGGSGGAEAHGLGQLTVRGVAAAAGMNIAAVNYYFRSKAALVATALDGSIRHMMQDTEVFLSRMSEDPVRVFGELLHYLLEGALRYPRLTKAHVHDAFVRDDYSGPFPEIFAPLVKRLAEVIRAAVPGLDQRRAARRAMAALSAVLLPTFLGGLFQPLDALASPGDRSSYAQEVALSALAPAESTGRVSRARPRARARRVS